ncbi:MAG: Lauroyl/myristoyl acyltransferase involved in lipid biosynthesis [Pseudonocardia sp.]|nr:Lauroyl/myristoyl acyltransferase involved in lipid biosynthesis [Pseudonocardia sp.]
MSAASDWVADVGFGAGWGLVPLLPEPVARAAFQAVGDLAARREAPTRQLRANLRRVLPGASPAELEAVVRAAMRSYARYWCEAFRLSTMDPAEIHDRMHRATIGFEHIVDAVVAGRGVIIALTHSGNWDATAVWMIEWLRRQGLRPSVAGVAERLRPESVYRRFVAYREAIGLEVLPMTGGERSPYSVMASRLNDNGVVALLSDRDLSGRGTQVSFFGEPARLPAGPALLAARTGAALLPLSTWFTPDGWGVRVKPAVPVPSVRAAREATQQLADALAAEIADHPCDWHMMQRVWQADMPAKQARETVP